jgi:hypothetical protein
LLKLQPTPAAALQPACRCNQYPARQCQPTKKRQ